MTGKGKRIVVRPTNNDLAREFHIEGASVCDLSYAEFWNPSYGNQAEDFEALGPMGKKIASSLLTKEHEKKIAQAKFRPQSVKIYMTPTADWTTVEQIVIKKLQQALGSEFKPVQYGKSEYRQLAFA